MMNREARVCEGAREGNKINLQCRWILWNGMQHLSALR
jgi:hypothetical protein